MLDKKTFVGGIILIPCVISCTIIGVSVGGAGGAAAFGIGAIPGALLCGLIGFFTGVAIWLTLVGFAMMINAFQKKNCFSFFNFNRNVVVEASALSANGV